MRLPMRMLFFVAVIAIAAAPALAHHSLSSQFDMMRSIMLKGTITKVAWENPHVRIYLDSEGPGSSEVMHWQLEMASPNLLVSNGIKLDNLRRGDRVKVNAYPARNGSNLGYAQKIWLTPRP